MRRSLSLGTPRTVSDGPTSSLTRSKSSDARVERDVARRALVVLPAAARSRLWAVLAAAVRRGLLGAARRAPDAERLDPADVDVQALVGEGSYGAVHVGLHGPSGRAVAVKRIAKQWVCDEGQGRVLRRELQTLRALPASPFLARLLGSGQDADSVTFLLEYLPGGDLLRLLSLRGPLAAGAARFYVGCAALGLEALHGAGLAYRDLKPDNIVLDARGYAKLVDFGFARPLAAGERSRTICGSLVYMAPELVDHAGHGREVDLWALGVLLFELLAGQLPFGDVGLPPSDIALLIATAEPALPPAVAEAQPAAAALVAALLERDPARRAALPDVRAHAFFAGLDWAALEAQRLEAPFVPALPGGVTDASNFDELEPFELEPFRGGDDGWAADF